MNTGWLNKAEALNLQVENFVGGRSRRVAVEETIEKVSPRDGRVLSRFGNTGEDDLDAAVSNAREAYDDGRWCDLSANRRKEVLHRLADLVERDREDFALLESLDVGKPIQEALSFDVSATAGTIRYCAEAADKLHGTIYTADKSSLSYQLVQPIGVVAGIVGWNFPLVLAAQKLAPVLAAGNSLVLKPSELTSFSTARLASLAVEAGVPEGVFNVINGGRSVGAALARHRAVDLVTFTGSTHTGKAIMSLAGTTNLKRVVLECGGKAPNIVFDDCPNLESVADGIVARAFWNQGQVCTASSRVLMQESIKERLQMLIIERVAGLKPGDPLLAETKFGALVSHGHQQKVLSYVKGAETEGARKLYEGTTPAPFPQGFYASPVIFDCVQPSQKIAQEEIFGPVLSIMSFGDEDEAVRLANSTMYGLSAIVWTKDLGRAYRLSRRIKAGWITVNACERPSGGPPPGALPSGGHKDSGIGVEGGVEGLREYVQRTAVQYFV